MKVYSEVDKNGENKVKKKMIESKIYLATNKAYPSTKIVPRNFIKIVEVMKVKAWKNCEKKVILQL